jgi:hypothetical protein
VSTVTGHNQGYSAYSNILPSPPLREHCVIESKAPFLIKISSRDKTQGCLNSLHDLQILKIVEVWLFVYRVLMAPGMAEKRRFHKLLSLMDCCKVEVRLVCVKKSQQKKVQQVVLDACSGPNYIF